MILLGDFVTDMGPQACNYNGKRVIDTKKKIEYDVIGCYKT